MNPIDNSDGLQETESKVHSVKFDILKLIVGLIVINLLFLPIWSSQDDFNILREILFIFNLVFAIPIGFILIIMLIINLPSESQNNLHTFKSRIPVVLGFLSLLDFLFGLWVVENDSSGWAGLALIGINVFFVYPTMLVLLIIYLVQRRHHKKKFV